MSRHRANTAAKYRNRATLSVKDRTPQPADQRTPPLDRAAASCVPGCQATPPCALIGSAILSPATGTTTLRAAPLGRARSRSGHTVSAPTGTRPHREDRIAWQIRRLIKYSCSPHRAQIRPRRSGTPYELEQIGIELAVAPDSFTGRADDDSMKSLADVCTFFR